jgi:hypothetical protein
MPAKKPVTKEAAERLTAPSQKRKRPYPISVHLRAYLRDYLRSVELPVTYEDALKCEDAVPLLDNKGKDTLWETLIYEKMWQKDLYEGLKRIYIQLESGGDFSLLSNLYIDRVDYCTFGNTRPLRVRIVNQYNDNHDYFYLKRADASRVYGLELEELFSPNHINFLVDGDTLIEEHIAGIPGDDFIRDYLHREDLNEVRLAKEFIKFNERSFVRLLGDMRAYNYVIVVTPDFEENQYRVRSIDFDQQCYEGRRSFYLPQFFKNNLEVVELCRGLINYDTARQYQMEERSLIKRRMNFSFERIRRMQSVMSRDALADAGKIKQLRRELAEFHQHDDFLDCTTMGYLTFLNIATCLGLNADERAQLFDPTFYARI